jgi:acyl-CoA synthetase (NDP forming)
MSNTTDSCGTREAIRALIAPASVALIGASADEAKFSGQPLRNLQTLGYPGAIEIVNRRGGEIRGVPARSAIAELPNGIDAAFVMVPAADSLTAVEELGARGVRAAVIAVSGFAELGTEEGKALQERLAEVGRAAGVRLMGPNCNGLYRTRGPVPLGYNKTHSQRLVPGPVALISHSGAMLGAFAPLVESFGSGLSTFISCGNEVDLTLVDFLEYLIDDDDTRVISILLDGVEDGTRFRAAVQRATATSKPVVALKLGNSAAGTGAAQAHSSRMAGSQAAYDAVFAADRVVSVTTIESLALASALLGTGRRPRARSVVGVSTSGAGGVLLADALAAHGVPAAPLSLATVDRLQENPGFAQAQNPFDIGAAGPAGIAENFAALANDPAAGSLIFFFTPTPTAAWRIALAEGLAYAARGNPDLPIVVVCPAAPDPAETAALAAAGIPIVSSTGDAVAALAALQVLAGERAAPDAAASAPQDAALGLSEHQSKALLAAAGIGFVQERLAESADEAVLAATDLGYPVVLKAAGSAIAHKSEHGLVRVGVGDDDAVRAEFSDLEQRARALDPGGYQGVLVAQMAPPGVDVVVGTTRDRDFGAMVLVGAGGVLTELMEDIAVAPAPVDAAAALRLIRATRVSRMLDGYRGSPKVDIAALVRVVVAVSEFAAASSDVDAIDLNPVRVSQSGALALDALVVQGAK